MCTINRFLCNCLAFCACILCTILYATQPPTVTWWWPGSQQNTSPTAGTPLRLIWTWSDPVSPLSTKIGSPPAAPNVGTCPADLIAKLPTTLQASYQITWVPTTVGKFSCMVTWTFKNPGALQQTLTQIATVTVITQP